MRYDLSEGKKNKIKRNRLQKLDNCLPLVDNRMKEGVEKLKLARYDISIIESDL